MIGVAERTKPVRKSFAIGAYRPNGTVLLTWIPDGVTGRPRHFRIHRALLHKALEMARAIGDRRLYANQAELHSYLNGLSYATEVLGRGNPRPDANLTEGCEGRLPEGSRLNDALEGIDLPGCVQVVPTCPSCHSPDDVELADLPGGDVECWCCVACGRAFREELIAEGKDVCGACIGTKRLSWEVPVGPVMSDGCRETEVHSDPCHFCGGKGR